MKQWVIFVTLVNMMRVVKVQYAVPMYAMPPAAMPVVLPALTVQLPQSTTAPTTTTSRNVAYAVPVPVQMPMQVALPAYAPPKFCLAKPRKPSCPPCPPCLCFPTCTPSFFAYCSPCHQKCRCRNTDDAPIPLPPNPPIPLPGPAFPMPVPGSPPLVIVPFPPSIRFQEQPRIRHKPKPYFLSDTSSDTSDESTDDSADERCSSSDTDYYVKRTRKRKKAHRKRKRISGRRNIARSQRSDREVVKPVLTYVSQNGNVKFKTKISNAEAAHFLGEKSFNKQNTHAEKVQVVANEDSENRPQVVVMSHDTDDSRQEMGRKQLFLQSGSSKHVLQKGKKEIVFRPPSNKKISNLSVSFMVTE